MAASANDTGAQRLHFDFDACVQSKGMIIAQPTMPEDLGEGFEKLNLKPALTVVALHEGAFTDFSDEDSCAFQVAWDSRILSMPSDVKKGMSNLAKENQEGLPVGGPALSADAPPAAVVTMQAAALYGVTREYDAENDPWTSSVRAGYEEKAALTADDVCLLRTTQSGVLSILGTLQRSRLVIFIGHGSALAKMLPNNATISGPAAVFFFNCQSETVLTEATVTSPTAVLFVFPTDVFKATAGGSEMGYFCDYYLLMQRRNINKIDDIDFGNPDEWGEDSAGKCIELMKLARVAKAKGHGDHAVETHFKALLPGGKEFVFDGGISPPG